MKIRLLILGCCLALYGTGQNAPARIGTFEGHDDVGSVLRPGAAEYDGSARTYTVTGSGENMWAAKDAFHFVWKKVSGDVTISADIAFPEQGGEPHRKAVLMIRQSLDEDRLTSTRPVMVTASRRCSSAMKRARQRMKCNRMPPDRSAFVSPNEAKISNVNRGSRRGVPDRRRAARVTFQEPFYVGIGVCAHNKERSEKAVFSNVEIRTTDLSTTEARPS